MIGRLQRLVAALALAACLWLMDRHARIAWTRPLLPCGVKPLLAFVGSGAMARVLGLIRVPLDGQSVPPQRAVFAPAFEPWLPLMDASLAYALVFVALWLALLAPLSRKGWYLRV